MGELGHAEPNAGSTPGVKTYGTRVNNHDGGVGQPRSRNMEAMAVEVMAAVHRRPDMVDETIVEDVCSRRAACQASYNAIVATQPNFPQRLASRFMTKAANRAMIKDPTLFYGIESYVLSNGLTTENACRFHKTNEMWGMVFRVKMAEPLHAIANDVE